MEDGILSQAIQSTSIRIVIHMNQCIHGQYLSMQMETEIIQKYHNMTILVEMEQFQ